MRGQGGGGGEPITLSRASSLSWCRCDTPDAADFGGGKTKNGDFDCMKSARGKTRRDFKPKSSLASLFLPLIHFKSNF